MSIHVNIKKYKFGSMNGFYVLFSIVLAFLALSYILMHNPHKALHDAVFTTAEKVHQYYRDQPGYWKLSTQNAKNQNLYKNFEKYAEYDIQIGQGLNGDLGLPSNLSFNIVLKHISKSACINLSELPMSDEHKLLLQKITIINQNQDSHEFSWGEKDGLPMSKYAARNLCSPVENTLIWTFN